MEEESENIIVNIRIEDSEDAAQRTLRLERSTDSADEDRKGCSVSGTGLLNKTIVDVRESLYCCHCLTVQVVFPLRSSCAHALRSA